MHQFKNILPVLKVNNLDHALAFHQYLLGFTLDWRAPNDDDGENAMLSAGPVSLLLSTSSHLGDKPNFSGTLYFNVQGVTAPFESLKDRVEVVWPFEQIPYNQLRLGVHDPDGYTLAFAEESPSV